MGTLRLPCKMTDLEQAEAGQKLAEANRHLTAAEDEKREANRAFNDQIKSRKLHVNTLVVQVTSGVIRKDVEVDYREPPGGGPKVLYRLDTDPPEAVGTANIDPDERQLELGKDGPKKKDKRKAEKKAQTDEQRDAATPEEAEQLREARLRQERRQAVGESLSEIMAGVIVLPNEDDGFTARAGANPPMWEPIITATGDTEEEAKAALLERLIDKVMAFDEEQASARSERIMTRLGELLAAATVAEERDLDDKPFFVARADGGTWTAEAMGDDAATASANLREKLLAALQAQEAEVKQLAAEQEKDEAKDKGAGKNGVKPPRRGLKPPKKGPKPKTHRRAKHDDGPPNGRDGKPLDF